MIVCIDCGHGLTTKGKQCLDGTKEWVLNSRIGEYVEKMLTERGITVVRSDDRSGKTDVPLSSRVRKANEVADYFISIHHNAGIKGGHGGGIVVFWYSSKSERERQARALYNRAVAITGLKGNRSNPVVKKSFYVLRKTKCPALLIECGFMDSVRDLPIIKTEEFALGIAQAITEFVLNDIK